MGAWHAWLLRVSLTLTIGVILLGCGDEETRSPAHEAVSDEQKIEKDVEGAASQDEVMSEPVTISLTTETRADQRLRITGRTNLPDETELSVLVERVASGVRWRHLARVREGSFSAEPFGPGSGLPEGDYALTVSVRPSSTQPEGVRDVIGERGEHLVGELVSESRHQGATATYTTRYRVAR